MAEDFSPTDSLEQPVASPAPGGPSMIHKIFIGPNGLRAGWRLLIFAIVVALLSLGVNFTLRHIAPVRDWFRSQPKDAFTPAGLIIMEAVGVFILLASVGVMSLIEKRSFADYGMPLNEAFGKRFWQGVPVGFAMLSLLLAMIAALHGFSLGGIALGGAAAVKYGAFYFIGFILVGIFEEFSFRGYLQFTLGSGIGFRPAAMILAIIFGAGHLNNPGEAKIGGFMAGCFGLVAAFALWRTGNLWFPIGMHASWDWGETYFYGTPDSGLLAQGHFLNSSFHGPAWLTGGTVGPEGSWLVFLVLIIWAVVIHFLFPAKPRTA